MMALLSVLKVVKSINNTIDPSTVCSDVTAKGQRCQETKAGYPTETPWPYCCKVVGDYRARPTKSSNSYLYRHISVRQKL